MEEKMKFYSLPPLPYSYDALEPYISEEQLGLHHDKHHQSYVTKANTVLEILDKARKEGAELNLSALAKEFSFNIGGHVLHSLFWSNLASANQGGGGEPSGTLGDLLKDEFGSFERFKNEFTKVAVSAEGSGWAALSFCRLTRRPIIMQIEKHNVNVFPDFRIIMVLDVWEHAYYLDYKNERAKFVEAFWSLVNWGEVNKRIEELLK
ncbi:MAG: superoxide dismutase [Patescibacteria group bacterium]|nr:superoxide dismutase [Patescibacteria group bacterium]